MALHQTIAKTNTQKHMDSHGFMQNECLFLSLIQSKIGCIPRDRVPGNYQFSMDNTLDGGYIVQSVQCIRCMEVPIFPHTSTQMVLQGYVNRNFMKWLLDPASQEKYPSQVHRTPQCALLVTQNPLICPTGNSKPTIHNSDVEHMHVGN